MRRFPFLLLLLALIACKKPVPPEAAAADVPPPSEPAPAVVPVAPTSPTPLERVAFEYDSAGLTSTARTSVQRDGATLQAHPDVRVEVQGHADERGSTEYNLALGQRRAETVRQALTASGVAGSRLETVSYGEERPRVDGGDEAAWAENRRAELRVTSGADAVEGTVP